MKHVIVRSITQCHRDVKTFISLYKAFVGAKANVPVRKKFDVHEMTSSTDLQKYTLARGVCTSVETTQNYHQQSFHLISIYIRGYLSGLLD
jgi:hypothetical protein